MFVFRKTLRGLFSCYLRPFVLLPRANAPKVGHIWYRGLDSVNTRCYVDVTILAKAIGYLDALPEIYTYTECGYTPAFNQKGKGRLLALMRRH